MHQAIERPLAIDFGLAAEGETVQALAGRPWAVVPQITKLILPRFDGHFIVVKMKEVRDGKDESAVRGPI